MRPYTSAFLATGALRRNLYFQLNVNQAFALLSLSAFRYFLRNYFLTVVEEVITLGRLFYLCKQTESVMRTW